MAVLDIVTYPSDILKQVAADVSVVGPEEKQLVSDMIDTMIKNKGVGLAATQVGVLKRIIICSPRGKRDELYVFVNPVIVSRQGSELDSEGCLSIPCATGDVDRATEISLEALDGDGNRIDFEASGFFARIIQHETDHLNGTLFIDHLGFLARQEAIDCTLKAKRL